MHCIKAALFFKKRNEGKPLLFKKSLRSRFTCLACQHFSFHAKKSLARERPFSPAVRVVSLYSCLSRLALSVTRVVICVSRAFCSTDQEKRETARSVAPFYSFCSRNRSIQARFLRPGLKRLLRPGLKRLLYPYTRKITEVKWTIIDRSLSRRCLVKLWNTSFTK